MDGHENQPLAQALVQAGWDLDGSATRGHPEDVTAYLGSDVYRISTVSAGAGWKTLLPSTLATAAAGKTEPVRIHVQRGAGASGGTEVRVKVSSESDPAKTAISTCHVG